MRRIAWLLLLIPATAAAQDSAARREESSCTANCHGKEADAYRECVHRNELRCIDCHGGDPAAFRSKSKAHAADKGYRGRPARNEIPELCGGCHADPLRMHDFGLPTDPLAQYKTSAHGQALLGRGDDSVAVCTDCHGTHRVLPARDPRAPTARINLAATCGRCHSDPARMQPHGLPATIADEFRASVHGRALEADRARGAPSCADCHGAHGARPPGGHGVVEVCGRCHQHTAEEYRKSAHFSSAEMRCESCHEDEQDARFRRGSDCTVCHGVHDIGIPDEALYTNDAPGRCDHCHREEGDGMRGLRQAIVGGRESLRRALSDTMEQIEKAKRGGVFLQHERVFLLESRRSLVELQPLTHSLDTDAVRRHVEDGLKRQESTRETLAKRSNVLRDRRIILSALAGLLLLLAALAAVKLQAVRRLS